MKLKNIFIVQCALFFLALSFIFSTGKIHAASIDIQKIRLKGAQYIKDLKYFQETGLVPARQTAIEMQIENFEQSLIGYRTAKPNERNGALRIVQGSYEKFNVEFRALADIYREWVDKYQKQYYEKSSEPFADTTTKEKTIATVAVARQDEARASSAYNNRNYAYAAHLYLRSLKHYHQAYQFRKWPQLVQLIVHTKEKPKNK
ncbi:MAG TPA: hypothetical protein PLY93_10670 [Turneriella sp.]|nr:hypothetical protein [Turneriella sp.]